jgi:branched-chain amino acid transport system substrate-binding protein
MFGYGKPHFVGRILSVCALLMLSVMTIIGGGANEVASATPKPCVIGGTPSLSGPSALFGKSVTQGGDLAASELKSSKAPVKIYWEDGQALPAPTVTAFKYLTSVKHAVAVITQNTEPFLAIAPLAAKARTVIFNISAQTPLQLNYKWVYSDAVLSTSETAADAKLFYSVLGVTNVAIIAENDSYGTTSVQDFESAVAAQGSKVTVGTVEYIDPTATDFTGPLATVAASKPQGVIMYTTGTAVGLMLQQAKQEGLTPKYWLGNEFTYIPSSIANAPGAANGAYQTGILYNPAASTVAKKFAAAYEKKYGAAPDVYAANTFDAVMAISTAVAKYGCSGPAVKKGLATITNQEGAAQPHENFSHHITQPTIGLFTIVNNVATPYTP